MAVRLHVRWQELNCFWAYALGLARLYAQVGVMVGHVKEKFVCWGMDCNRMFSDGCALARAAAPAR